MSDVSDVPRSSTSDIEDVSDVSYVLQIPLFVQRGYNRFCLKLLQPLCSWSLTRKVAAAAALRFDGSSLNHSAWVLTQRASKDVA